MTDPSDIMYRPVATTYLLDSCRVALSSADTACNIIPVILQPCGCFVSYPQLESLTMLEWQREGIAKAKREGKYKGRAPTARAKAEEVRRLAKAGGLTREAIAKQLGIGVASVYRVLAETHQRAGLA